MKLWMMCLSLCKGFDRIVGLLIQNNANINTVNKDGYSPLHFASVKGISKIVECSEPRSYQYV